MPIGKQNGAVAEAPAAQTPPVVEQTKRDVSYQTPEDAKSTRILRQGVYQAVVQAAGLSVIPYTTEAEFVALVERVAEKVITLVQK